MLRLQISLRFNPRDWGYYDHGHMDIKCFRLTNHRDQMELWIANSAYGLHFTVGDRKYGGVTLMGSFIPALWRWELLGLGKKAVNTGWVKPYE